MRLRAEDVAFAPASLIDDVGRVFFHEHQVFRAIYSAEHAELYANILREGWIDEAFALGLVSTKIAEQVSLEGAVLTLEHERLPFETHPAESTNKMHWLAAKAIVDVNICLARHGLLLKDAHPWNLMFNKGAATVVDFGSVIRTSELPAGWLDEFRRYFAAPIWLASTRWRDYAHDYRRQHGNGFGLRLSESRLSRRWVLRGLDRLRRHAAAPGEFFAELKIWLDGHRPAGSDKAYWADYRQCGESANPLEPEHPKHRFVHDILTTRRPARVLDLAANKGYYSQMAARLGASVVACDYEEYCVDRCLALAQREALAITPALLDFSVPTPEYGLGLYGGNSFERFRSDIVLALGLIHHICIAQRLPIEVFCDICMRYAKHGIVLEYVDPTDRHVANWGLPIPARYSIEGIANILERRFPRLVQGEIVADDGLCRVMVYFGDE